VAIPEWQGFGGLDAVLAKLNSVARLDDFGRLLFFYPPAGSWVENDLWITCERRDSQGLQAAEGYVP